MFTILQTIYLAVILFQSITLSPVGVTAVPLALDAYVAVNFHREFWREDGEGKCTYNGVLVPYERLWSEEIRNGDEVTILPPEPGKIAGYIAVVNRLDCKGKAPVAILRTGVARTLKPFFQDRQVNRQAFFQAGDLLETPADKMPMWFPQVIQRLELLAKTDKKADAFLNASVVELNKAVPGLPGMRTVAAGATPAAAPAAP